MQGQILSLFKNLDFFFHSGFFCMNFDFFRHIAFQYYFVPELFGVPPKYCTLASVSLASP